MLAMIYSVNSPASPYPVNLNIHQHHSALPKDRSLSANAGTKAVVVPKAGLPPQTQEPRLQFYQG